jgi:hypothetical protein
LCPICRRREALREELPPRRSCLDASRSCRVDRPCAVSSSARRLARAFRADNQAFPVIKTVDRTPRYLASGLPPRATPCPPVAEFLGAPRAPHLLEVCLEATETAFRSARHHSKFSPLGNFAAIGTIRLTKDRHTPESIPKESLDMPKNLPSSTRKNSRASGRRIWYSR